MSVCDIKKTLTELATDFSRWYVRAARVANSWKTCIFVTQINGKTNTTNSSQFEMNISDINVNVNESYFAFEPQSFGICAPEIWIYFFKNQSKFNDVTRTPYFVFSFRQVFCVVRSALRLTTYRIRNNVTRTHFLNWFPNTHCCCRGAT